MICDPKPSECPFATRPLKMCKEEYCGTCIAKSLASNERAAACWHPTKNGKLKPRHAFKSSNKMIYFKCDMCPHDFKMTLSNVSKGCWCGYCAKHNAKLCSDLNCEKCLGRSLESFLALPSTSLRWSNEANGMLTPRQLSKDSNRKAWFYCPSCGQTRHIRVNDVTVGKGCVLCQNKCELKMFLQLRGTHPDLIPQFTADWCQNTLALRFDFALVTDKIIIEMDGNHHFKKIPGNLLTFEEFHARDVYKQKCANTNGYSMIRVLSMDVWRDKNDWLAKVVAAIAQLRSTGIVDNIYIGSGSEYDIFQTVV